MAEIKKVGDYYEVVLGRLPPPTHLFASLKQRADQGQLHCEFGSPTKMPGTSQVAFNQRYREIRTENVCATIQSLEPAADGKSLIGHVVPTGPYGKALEEIIKDQGLGKVVFAARSFINSNGQLSDVVTYDVVPE